MGVNLDRMREYGERLRDVPARERKMPDVRGALLIADTPLSGPLAGLQEQKAYAAVRFVESKDKGVVRAGNVLEQNAVELTAMGHQHAKALQRFFPNAAPDTGGGQR